MHICRLIRKRCNSKSWKKVKNFLYFAKRRNFESITNSPEWSATTSSKGKQAKKLDDFLRRLKCVLNLWKSLWHAFVKAFQPSLLFLRRYKVLFCKEATKLFRPKIDNWIFGKLLAFKKWNVKFEHWRRE